MLAGYEVEESSASLGKYEQLRRICQLQRFGVLRDYSFYCTAYIYII